MIPTSTGLEGRIAELERQVAALLSGNVLENASLALGDGTVVTTTEMAEAPAAAIAAGEAAATAGESATAAGEAAAAAGEAATAAGEAATAAGEEAGQALSIANGKTTTYVGAVLPAVPDSGHAVNDEWVDTRAGGPLLRTWDGADWALRSWGYGALAAESVTAGAIAAGAVATTALAAEAVTAAKILSGTITASQIASGTITAGLIAAGAITTAKLAAGAVTTTELAAGAVTAAKITAGTITGTEIAAGAITAAKITGGTITAAEIASGTITGDRLAANTITADRLSATAIDGKTITGALLRTASSGARVELDSTNGLRGIDGTGTTKTQLTTGGAFSATGATISGEIRTADSGPRVVTRQIPAPAGVNEVVTGVVEMYDSGNSTPSTLKATTTTTVSPARTTRTAALKVGDLGGQTGSSVECAVYAGYSVIYLHGGQVNAEGPIFSDSYLSTMGDLYGSGTVYARDGYANGGVTIAQGISAAASLITDSNVSAGGQVIIGAAAPLAGDHAVRRDYITTRLEGGSATFTFPAANTTYSQTVTFAVAKATTPAVVVTAVSANPQNYVFSIGGLTNSSFTLYGRALVTGSASCRWVACSL